LRVQSMRLRAWSLGLRVQRLGLRVGVKGVPLPLPRAAPWAAPRQPVGARDVGMRSEGVTSRV
jgi:hypothetical protein